MVANDVSIAAQFLGIDLQKPYLEIDLGIINGSHKGYPSNGINFASAGSGVLNDTNLDLGVMPIQEQLLKFQNLMKSKKVDIRLVEQSLFFFESGSNDIFNYFLPFFPPTLEPDAFVLAMLTQVKHFVYQTYKLGARRFGIFGLGPVGCVPARVNLPEAPIDRCYGKMNKMVKNYNLGLESIVNDFPVTYPGAISVYGAVYDIVQLFRAIPQHYGSILPVIVNLQIYSPTMDKLSLTSQNIRSWGYSSHCQLILRLFQKFIRFSLFLLIHCSLVPYFTGFTNTTSACCGNGTLGGLVQCGTEGSYEACKNPNEFLFWDYFHPSERSYKLLSKALWAGKRSRIRPFNLKTLANITVSPS
ncbi:hypothetical protein GIB67_024948 [Kingdonia uniflora]|uniref:Uncharacterized protein n=1 Tax=Kingdonia uniflora TaxID=39325 RepID=A0A7J7NYR1_9MAGN|nr:hypothetical protein GIB67_024948 [Kingdonia uniflora]